MEKCPGRGGKGQGCLGGGIRGKEHPVDVDGESLMAWALDFWRSHYLGGKDSGSEVTLEPTEFVASVGHVMRSLEWKHGTGRQESSGDGVGMY